MLSNVQWQLEVHFCDLHKLVVGVGSSCANTPTDVFCKIMGGWVSDKVNHDLDFVCMRLCDSVSTPCIWAVTTI